MLPFHGLILTCFIKASNLGDIESKLSSLISAGNIKETLAYYTSKTHIAGSENDKLQADWTLDQFESFGLNAAIMEYYPLLSYPLERSIIMKSPFAFTAKLMEDIVDEDDASTNPNAAPTFLGYSANGSFQNLSMIYANFCSPKDFDLLHQKGISAKGKLVICKYGSSFRGLKVRAAEMEGAAAVIIYSDPNEDGFVQGPVYPAGRYRPSSSVQRGSVQNMYYYAGDPLTPFTPAHKNSARINVTDANIPKIPCLPLSYGDARNLLKGLTGHGVKVSDIGAGWQGGLEFDYWTGPFGEVDFNAQHEFKVAPIWNVFATIEGKIEPDRVIVFGNHRDAWVYGAVDPGSGSAILVELARVFGELVKLGWRPSRTLIFASWDGEEYGMLGSTEWVEDNVKSLNKTMVAYVNIDQAVYGTDFSAKATPNLANLIRSVAKDVKDPNTGDSLYNIWLNSTISKASGPQFQETTIPKVGLLGSGSDYVSFLTHVGISSMDLRFTGGYGIYHSNYDSFHWMEKFGDPKFLYHRALCELTGRILLRLLDSPILPFDFSEYSQALSKHSFALQKALSDAGMNNSIAKINEAIAVFQKKIPKLETKVLVDQNEGTEGVTFLNDKLAFAERYFIDLNGLKGREWYRHVVYAPGEWTGYGAQTFPSVHEAIAKAQGVDKAIDQVVEGIWRVINFWDSK